MTTHPFKPALITTIGALGYLFCLLQWIWAAVIFLPAFLDSGFMKQFMQKPVVVEPVVSQPVGISTAGIVFGVAVVIIMTILTIYVCIKLPSTIGKTGSKIAHRATEMAIPIVTNHKKIPKKRRLQLTTRLLFIVKIVLCVIPFGLIFFINTPATELARDIIVIIGSITAICSIGLFCLQATSAKLLRVDYKHVW